MLSLELATIKEAETLGAASTSPTPLALNTAEPGVAVREASPGRA